MTNGFLGNGDLELDKNQLPVKQIPIEEVDSLADELVSLYHNPAFRQWYCGVIYEFGINQVVTWQRRAEKADEPAKLFSYYVKQARRGKAQNSNIKSSADSGTDTVYTPSDEELTDEALSHSLDNVHIEDVRGMAAPGKAVPWLDED